MNEVYLILIPGLAAVMAWLAGRGVGRWFPGWRHAPWIALTGLGCALLAVAVREDTGSTMGSGFAHAANLLMGGLLTAAGLAAGALTWLFPGSAPRRYGPAPSHTAVPGATSVLREESLRRFTLLRYSLDPEIQVDALIQAARTVPSIQEADCRMIAPHAGILFRNLDEADALRLQDALNAQNLPVYLAEQTRLSPLPVGRRAQALRLQEDALVETDCVGREHRHPLRHIAWCGAGRIEDLVYQETAKIRKRVTRDMRGQTRVETSLEKERGLEELTALRLEVLIPGEPGRIIWTCDQKQRRVLQNQPVGPGDTGTFEVFLRELCGRMPPERLSSAVRHLGSTPLRVYPSLKAFEDEVQWTRICRELQKQELTS